MANLKGSIRTEENLKGSVTERYNLQGAIKTIYNLVGSVDNFLRSLTIRAFIQPMANIYTSVIAYRYIKANMYPNSSVTSRFKTLREMKNINISARSSITISTGVERNIKANIEGRSIFGKETTLELIDNLTLDQLDSLTLGELEFTEGVYCNVVKSVTANILSIAQISATVYTLRYNKLDDFDSLTLNDMDSQTLNDLDETLN